MCDAALSGMVRDKAHSLALRVYYVDTDAGGVVYHAAYLAFAERARTEMLRSIGVDLLALKEEKHLMFAVRRAVAEYFRPARLDDLLEIRSVLRGVGGASVEVDQSVWRGEVELVRMHLKLACMHQGGKAFRIPAALREILQAYVKETD